MIKVAEQAKIKISQLLEEEGQTIENSYVRVGVKGGGCSGLSYVLDFTQQKDNDDKEFEDKGVRILVDKKAFYMLLVLP